MEIEIGCDIVQIARFERSADKGGKEFLNKVFSVSELAHAPTVETLTGIFAAKEAVIKALEMKVGDWRKIEIMKNGDGRPEARVAEFSRKIIAHDLSISHDGDYAMAVAIFIRE